VASAQISSAKVSLAFINRRQYNGQIFHALYHYTTTASVLKISSSVSLQQIARLFKKKRETLLAWNLSAHGFARSAIDKPAVQQITHKSHPHHNKWRKWSLQFHMHSLQSVHIQGQMVLFGNVENLKLEILNPHLLCNALRNF
jgi:hypothetical protein